MIKVLAPAAFAVMIGFGAFAAPASAQGVSISVGSDRPYYGERHYHRHHHRPGVRIYSGRSSYVDNCRTRRTERWVNGRRVIRTVRVCD